MGERRVLSDQEVGDLVSRLRSLEWSWDPSDVDRLVESFGWTIVSRRSRFVRLDAGFGMTSGHVDFSRTGRAQRIRAAVCESASAESAEGQAYVQDVFAQVVVAAGQALGKPTEQISGESPEVRWRGADTTVGVKRTSVRVNVFLATNDYIDDFDWAVSQGL